MGAWEAVVLGIAQDGGVPHPGCTCARCDAAANGRAPRLHVACLGLTNGERAYLLDATPDLPAQLRTLGFTRPDGIFLTHAHMGHVTGLVYLGREALATRGVAVHGTASMLEFLRTNAPFRDLEEQHRVALLPNERVELGGLVVEAVPVPHRSEHTDTVGYRVEGPRGSLLFIPDIDAWDTWDRDVRDEVAAVDVAYLDATFLSADELPHRDPAEIPHPFALETMARLDGLGDRVRLIHLNHTNPLLGDDAPAVERGFAVAREGERFAL
jgi:pyrroloquinoline quinone biosynthesis protein B